MIIPGTIFVILIAYLLTGGVAARLVRPTLIAVNTIEKGEPAYRTDDYWGTKTWYTSDGEIRRDLIREEFWQILLLWPVSLPVFLLNHSLDQAMDKVDPKVHAEQAAKIARLERELDLS